jgi:ABC-type transporter Mla maintaining outer membrane lipid asymmetry ATPase subunit MlaF
LKLFEREEELQAALQAFLAQCKSRRGLVSLETPLISNLAVWMNIALIPQYHQNMPEREAKAMTLNLLQRLDVPAIAEKRNPTLTTAERFCAMLLRAAVVKDAIVVLDKPFRILTDLPDSGFIMETLGKIDDLIAEIYIFDYSWEKDRYEIPYGPEH